MTPKFISLFLGLILGLSSCSPVKLKSRKGQDMYLKANAREKLSGSFLNLPADTAGQRRPLYSNFNHDTVYTQNKLLVNIHFVGKNKMSLKLSDKGQVIDSMIIRGKFRRGYFKLREFKTEFIAGPLLWVLAENTKFMGLTNADNLVIINSGGSGFLFAIAFPIFAAGSGQREYEYLRQK